MLQPIERRFARQRSHIAPSRLQRRRQQRQRRIMTQFVVIVQILIAQSDTVNALGHERLKGVVGARLVTVVGEALRHPPGQATDAINFAQQQHSCIRRHGSAIERRHHGALLEALKRELTAMTLCFHQTIPEKQFKSLNLKNYN